MKYPNGVHVDDLITFCYLLWFLFSLFHVLLSCVVVTSLMAELKKAFFGEHVFKGVYTFHSEWPIIAKGKARSITVGFIVLGSI